eukprot:CAMPEP_0183344736 /NCGR_PEP_ID=MMETSP0164_2-20130417/10332_1 /TAXON_ID=221442 /ORGANISM="Coccolithus pelagicus ssp braarudi, Strain PLY182g" /LENGTH=54 /DNA_ID=CAMNT_0025515777 /DNA_START=7 /DNA_END=171 /DNA_ORIENTATION=-
MKLGSGSRSVLPDAIGGKPARRSWRCDQRQCGHSEVARIDCQTGASAACVQCAV